MAALSVTNVDYIDVRELLMSCGYTALTAKNLRGSAKLWPGAKFVSRDAAVERLSSLLASTKCPHRIRSKIEKVLENLRNIQRSECAPPEHASPEHVSPDIAPIVADRADKLCGDQSEVSVTDSGKQSARPFESQTLEAASNNFAKPPSVSMPPPFRTAMIVTKLKGKTDDDLYVMELIPKSGSGEDRCLYKIGKSKDVEARRCELALDFSMNYWVAILVIIKRSGDLEQHMHRRLQEYRCDTPRHRSGKEIARSREVFDLSRLAGHDVIADFLVKLAENIVETMDLPHRSLDCLADTKRRRTSDNDVAIEKEKTLQVQAEASARKAEAEAAARVAEARTRQMELFSSASRDVQIGILNSGWLRT
jgi:hypothetical protein